MLYCPDTSVRPPRVLARSFPSCPHHLYYTGFRAVIGLRLVRQSYPPAFAFKWFLFVGAKVCLHLPSALLNLAARTLVFSYILPTAGRIRDLHSLERAPAGRTAKTAACPIWGKPPFASYLMLILFLSLARPVQSLPLARLSSVRPAA